MEQRLVKGRTSCKSTGRLLDDASPDPPSRDSRPTLAAPMAVSQMHEILKIDASAGCALELNRCARVQLSKRSH